MQKHKNKNRGLFTGMRKAAMILLIALHIASPIFASSPPEVISETAVVIDMSDGAMLYGKNAQRRMYPASITKMLSCAIVLNGGDLNDTVTASKTAVNIMSGATNIALKAGEQLSLGDLLYATALRSANDAANAIAEYSAGSIEAFAVKMNQFAVRAGALESSFTNPSGLYDDNHFTTAYDMALIAKSCFDAPGFEELFSTLEYTIPKTELTPERKILTSNQLLIAGKDHYYEYALCSKSGWTTPSQNTLISFAQKDGIKLVCVVLKSEKAESKYLDTIALFEHCFENYESLKTDKAEDSGIPGGEIGGGLVNEMDSGDGAFSPVSGGAAAGSAPGGDIDYPGPESITEISFWLILAGMFALFMLISLLMGTVGSLRHRRRRARGRRVM